MPKVLVTDPLSELGLNILKEAAEVIYEPGMSPDKIKEVIGDCDGMLVRSGTTVTEDILNSTTSKMKIIGRAGVGVDNINVDIATKKGIIVVNSPDGNTTAAAEHTVSMMMSLTRNIPKAHESMFTGKWDRKSFTGVELRGKTLGIIGLGKIGSKVAQTAKAIGMKLIAYDPFASQAHAESLKATLYEDINEIWKQSDFITLHIPKTPQTANLVNTETISLMKDGVRIINCARGGVINEADLAEALKSGKVAGAALDVFDQEPINQDNPLLKLKDKVILTPHLGAATEEAQINVAVDVAEQIKTVLNGGFATSAVNLRGLHHSKITGFTHYMQLAYILGRFLAEFGGIVKTNSFQVEASGKLTEEDLSPLVLSSLSGFLSASTDGVSLVNAKLYAEDRKIQVSESKLQNTSADEIIVKIKTEDGQEMKVSGTLHEDKKCIITGLQQHRFFLQPYEHMLITCHQDKAGAIAKITKVLGDNNINISGLIVRRQEVGKDALLICGIDEKLNNNILAELNNIDEIDKSIYMSV